MSRTAAVLITLWVMAGFNAAFIQGCTCSTQPPAGGRVTLVPTKRVFAFDPSLVSRITLAKADPATGDHWTARLKKTEAGWIVETDSDGSPLIDTQANSGFFVHLLDNLQTFQMVEEAPNGPPESFGLAPPLFAIRWDNGSNHEFELRIGSPAKNGFYCLIPEANPKVIVGSGAAAKLLTFLDSYLSVRNRTWSTMTTDDVDIVELFQKGKRTLYAERAGSAWWDTDQKPLRVDVTAKLEQLTHARIEAFIDDPVLAEKIGKSVRTNPLYEARMTDRKNSVVRLRAKKIDNALYGVIDTRPKAVFRLFPKVAGFFR